MQRSVFLTASLCLFFATVYSGCFFVPEDCDYVETQCWDVVDVYCDPWGCWEDWYTECEDYCVDVAEPVAAPECTSDRHCPAGDICRDQHCVPAPSDHGQAGLCQACDVNADCAEPGALCLNLTPEATIGYCGLACEGDGDCPAGFECLSLQGVGGYQCVPENRSCEDRQPVAECTENSDCDPTEVCSRGRCVEPAPECANNDGCDAPQICVDGSCTDPECADSTECEAPQICADGLCVDPECIDNDGCEAPQICVDGGCTDPECADATECEAPQICADGLCTDPECSDNTDCGDNQECVDGACHDIEVATCERNVDCAGGGICVDGTCRNTCDTAEDCPGNQVCRAGLCSPPPEPECTVGTDCGDTDAFYCVNGLCRNACETTEDCDFGYLCRGFYCDVDPAVECRSTLECGLDERCVEGECLVECAASCNCPTGLSCDTEIGVCLDLPFPESCETDCDCPGGHYCSAEKTCLPL